jgi:hypothetical protein
MKNEWMIKTKSKRIKEKLEKIKIHDRGISQKGIARECFNELYTQIIYYTYNIMDMIEHLQTMVDVEKLTEERETALQNLSDKMIDVLNLLLDSLECATLGFHTVHGTTPCKRMPRDYKKAFELADRYIIFHKKITEFIKKVEEMRETCDMDNEYYDEERKIEYLSSCAEGDAPYCYGLCRGVHDEDVYKIYCKKYENKWRRTKSGDYGQWVIGSGVYAHYIQRRGDKWFVLITDFIDLDTPIPFSMLKDAKEFCLIHHEGNPCYGRNKNIRKAGRLISGQSI